MQNVKLAMFILILNALKTVKIDKAKMNKIYNKLASNLIVKGKPVWKNSQKAWLDYRTKAMFWFDGVLWISSNGSRFTFNYFKL